MKIQFLAPNFKTSRNGTITNSNVSLNSGMSYPNLMPLDKDTVSFTGGRDKLLPKIESKAKEKLFTFWNPDEAKNHKEILDLAQSFVEPLDKLTWDLKRSLKNLIATESNPENIIMPNKRGIKSRVKKPKSIAEKANSRELFNIEQIARMGDVGGARIVLRTANFEDTSKVFDAFKDIVKHGYKIKEIENYRLNPKDSYVSQKTLDKFEKYCIEHEQYPEVKNKALPNGYTAIHVTIELPDKKQVELQIMGRDIENVKEVEDFFYKYRCNKKFDPKFRAIQRIFDKYMPTLDEFQKETLNRYIKDSYINARHIPSRSAKSRFNPDKDFLPFPYSLPEKLSFSNLWKMMEKCQ